MTTETKEKTTQETAVAIKTETVLANFKDVQGMAIAFIKSGFFENMREASQAIVKIQAGRELGLPPVYAMQHIVMIKGRLTTDANCMALLVKSSGKYDYRIKKHDETGCAITFFEHGKEVGISIFTIDDAKRAGLIKPDSGWAKYPRAMLFSRAISQGARMYCPDAIGGVYTTEEMQATGMADIEIPEVHTESTARVIDEKTMDNEAKTEQPEDTAIVKEDKPLSMGEVLTWCYSHGKQYTRKWFLDNCGVRESELEIPAKLEYAMSNITTLTGWEGLKRGGN